MWPAGSIRSREPTMKKRTKFTILYTSIVALFAILSGRLWYLQVVEASHYRALGDTSKLRLESVPAPRGIIVDSRGRSLVYNVPSWTIEVVPAGVPSGREHTIYRALSRVLGGSPTPKQIAHQVQLYAWDPYQPVPIKKDVDTGTALIIEQMHLQLPGVQANPSSVRQYPTSDPNWSLSHILGYTGTIQPGQLSIDQHVYPKERFTLNDEAGLAGVESTMDPYLHGINGQDYVEVDAGERPVRTFHHTAAVPGDKVYLTINWKLEQEVSRDLAIGMQRVGGHQGAVVMEDPNTGKILAMVSYPGFNNNLFARGISQKAFSALQNDPADPLLDLATQGALPPGSTFKVITAAAALQTGVTDSSRIITDTGAITPCQGCITFHGWFAPGLGPVNIIGALAESSDIYFYTVSGGDPAVDPHMPYIGANRLSRWAGLFGLAQKTGIELPNEAAGQVPGSTWFNHLDLRDPRNRLIKNPGEIWTIGNTYNMGIGQGFDTATPLQMAGVAATIANNGTLYQPHIIDRIVGRVVPRLGATAHNHVIQPFVPTPIRSNFMSPETIALIQQGMRASVTLPEAKNGTSFNVTDPRINPAGKTGTAQDYLPNGTPAADAWWIGYAPYDHPKVAIAVLAEHANAEGAFVAAPIAHKALEDFFGLKPIGGWPNDVQPILDPGAPSQ